MREDLGGQDLPSDALSSWRGERANRLNELVKAHQTVGGTGAGRRWSTEQINLALALRLAVEFQGFSRELHDLASGTFGAWAAPENPAIAEVITGVLTYGRQLDRGNATESNLVSDFGRFGLHFAPTMKARDARTSQRLAELDRLNRARNAIAHDNPHVLAVLRREGRPIKLTTIKRWRSALNGLATTMDVVIAEHFARIFHRGAPW